MSSPDMWTLLELPRIVDLYDKEYIIYDVSDWTEEDATRAYRMLENRVEHDGSSVKTISRNNVKIIVRYPHLPIPKDIHVLTKNKGTKVTIPEGKTIEDFLEIYFEDPLTD